MECVVHRRDLRPEARRAQPLPLCSAIPVSFCLDHCAPVGADQPERRPWRGRARCAWRSSGRCAHCRGQPGDGRARGSAIRGGRELPLFGAEAWRIPPASNGCGFCRLAAGAGDGGGGAAHRGRSHAERGRAQGDGGGAGRGSGGEHRDAGFRQQPDDGDAGKFAHQRAEVVELCPADAGRESGRRLRTDQLSRHQRPAEQQHGGRRGQQPGLLQRGARTHPHQLRHQPGLGAGVPGEHRELWRRVRARGRCGRQLRYAQWRRALSRPPVLLRPRQPAGRDQRLYRGAGSGERCVDDRTREAARPAPTDGRSRGRSDCYKLDSEGQAFLLRLGRRAAEGLSRRWRRGQSLTAVCAALRHPRALQHHERGQPRAGTGVHLRRAVHADAQRDAAVQHGLAGDYGVRLRHSILEFAAGRGASPGRSPDLLCQAGLQAAAQAVAECELQPRELGLSGRCADRAGCAARRGQLRL